MSSSIAELIAVMMKKSQLEADVNAANTNGARGIYGGGRLGLNYPLNNGSIGIGAAGGGAYIPKYKVKEFNVNRVDANYQNGNNNFGVDFDPNDARHNFMLNFTHNF